MCLIDVHKETKRNHFLQMLFYDGISKSDRIYHLSTLTWHLHLHLPKVFFPNVAALINKIREEVECIFRCIFLLRHCSFNRFFSAAKMFVRILTWKLFSWKWDAIKRLLSLSILGSASQHWKVVERRCTIASVGVSIIFITFWDS